MFKILFQRAPGPTWLKAIVAVLAFAGFFYAMMEWGFPWLDKTFNLSGEVTTV